MSKNKRLNNLILHIHPRQIPEDALKFTLTWGLGGMATLLIVLLAITGIILRFYYVPTPDKAYYTVLQIKDNLFVGNLLRNIHYWSASLLILVSFLHLVRIVYTNAFIGKRGSNWIIGVCLLLLVIIMNFTGYLLPWDQLAYWAITVSTNMLKYIPLFGETLYTWIVQGNEVGAPTLLVFYNLHTGLIPLAMIILMLFHFWKIRKAGGVALPEPGGDKKRVRVAVWPNLLVREFVVALALLAFVLFLSVLFDAPLKEIASPTVSPNPAKAPWYFMGLQELLIHFHPNISVLLIPLFITVALFALPFLKLSPEPKGVYFLSDAGKKTALISFTLGTLLTIIYVIIDEYIIRASEFPLIIKNGVIPFVLLILFLFIYSRIIVKVYKLTRNEMVQSLFSYILAAFIVLTLVGNFLRGANMAFTL